MTRDFQGSPHESLRERKRRATSTRISEAGMRLFLERGYDETTLDDISHEAGISRRTFFHYFKSKDDILLSLQSGMGEMVAAALLDQPVEKQPFDALRDAIISVTSDYPADNMIAIDRLMRSNTNVQARKQASYVEHERTIFSAMQGRWPDHQKIGLRLIAMVAIGAIRLSLEEFGRLEGARPLADILPEIFDGVELTIR